MPLHVPSTCAHHQEVKISLHSLWCHHTYRWPFRGFISVFIPTWCTNFLFYSKFHFMPLRVSSTFAHHQELKISLQSLWYHHPYRWPSCEFFISVINQLDAQNICFTISLFRASTCFDTCAHHQEFKIALHSLWYHHTYRWNDTRGCVMQFWPPDDKHMCSKHVEAWNKLIVKQKFCASSWLITEVNIVKRYYQMCVRSDIQTLQLNSTYQDELRRRAIRTCRKSG